MTGQKSGGSNMCRMLGVDFDVSHGRYYCCQYYVPVLSGIFVKADFDGLEYSDLSRKVA